MRHRTFRFLIAGLSVVGIATGCGGGDSGSMACAPNASAACVGPAGCMGSQMCNADGSGFVAPCDCGGGVGGAGAMGGTGATGATGATGGAGGTAAAGGTGGTSGGCTTTFADLASSWCAKRKMCDNTEDEQTCINEITNLNAVRAPKYRCEYMQGFVSCIGGKDCVTTLNTSAFSECSTESLLLIAPTNAGATLCMDYQAAMVNCGRTFDNAECLEVVKTFSDATAMQGQNCTTAACVDIVDCVAAAFGDTQFGAVGCSDTCTYPADGDCDDGGPGSTFSLCDLGTDCTDCGPR